MPCMIAVITPFIPDHHKEGQAAADAQRQADDIDKRKDLVFPEVPEGCQQIVPEHNEVFSDTGIVRCAGLLPGCFCKCLFVIDEDAADMPILADKLKVAPVFIYKELVRRGKMKLPVVKT